MPQVVQIPADELANLRRDLREAREELAEWRTWAGEAQGAMRRHAKNLRSAHKDGLLLEVLREAQVPDGAMMADRWAAALDCKPFASAALVVLMDLDGRPVTYTTLNNSAHVYQARHCSEVLDPGNSAKVRMSQLRKAMAKAGLDPFLIKTLHGRGYQLPRSAVQSLTTWLNETHPDADSPAVPAGG